MATRIPLIVNASANQIQELPTGDSLSGIATLTATSFVKSGGISSQFLKADGSVTGIITASNLDGNQSGSAPIYGMRAYGKMQSGKVTPSIQYGGNIASVSRTTTGTYAFTLSAGIGNTSYVVVANTGEQSDNDNICTVGIVSSTSFNIFTYNVGASDNTLANTDDIYFTVIG